MTAKPSITPRELLNLREGAWAPRMADVSLVAENLPAATFAEQALTAFGRVLLRSQPWQYPHRLRAWPAVHVIATVRAAIDHYEQGTFWPKLGELTGLPADQSLQSEWGKAFLANLRTLRLPLFEDVEDPGLRYVGRILMHAGIPTYCLNDYFDLIAERRRRIIGLEPDEFVSWAGLQAAAGRLTSVDTPVRRFIRYGGEFAVDVTDRVFELLDVVSSGGDGTGVPLPERFRHEAQRWAAETPRARRSVAGPDTAAVIHPQLVLDQYGRGPLLRLPPVADSDGRAAWVVTIGNRTQIIATTAIWPGADVPAPSIDLAVVAPERAASVALQGYEQHQATVMIVDDKAPLLAFSEDGRLVPGGLPLPGAPVWLLFPGAPDSLTITGVSRTIAEGALPPGWVGWCLLVVDLSAASSVALSGSIRSVRHAPTARIVTDAPIDGFRSRLGLPVFDRRPRIELPDSQGSTAPWSIVVRDETGQILGRRDALSNEEANDVWSELEGPLVGAYTIRVRGPWGRGASREIEIVENAEVRVTPSWRRMDREGLVPAHVRLRLPEGIAADRDTVDLGSQDTVAQVELSTRSVARSYRIQPPHMSVSYQNDLQTSMPTIRALSLFAEDVIADAGVLTVHIGDSAEPRLYVRRGADVIQQLLPGAGRNGVYPFKLSQLTETLHESPQVVLTLDPDGQLAAARIRPRRLFEAASVENGCLTLSECRNVDGLTAVVYPTRAPWRGPIQLLVEDGSAELPNLLVEAGPLLVTVGIDDPWVPVSPPAWPQDFAATRIDGAGHLRSHDPEESAISAWLAGNGDLPVDIHDLSRLWTVLDRRHGLALGDRRRAVAADCVRALQQSPIPAFDALPIDAIDPADLPALLIRSGLLAHSDAAADEVLPGATWTRPTAVVASARWTRALLARSGEPETCADLVDDARTVCGDVLDLLVAGADPYAQAGRFDQNAGVYAHLPVGQRAELRAGLKLVPQGLLGQDTRVEASLELLDQSRHPLLKGVVREAHKRSGQIEVLLQRYGNGIGLEAFTARKHPTDNSGWRALSSLSIGFALAARHAARGCERARTWLSAHQSEWADLASVAPELITIDFVRAELILSAALTSPMLEGTP